ncbi:transketolase family protein [Faecalispora jeddahensis]|uniref:transketolase family protein n=1 Tax=Faecalispora jeddahensis TaxID=1414721 RepID=UPI0027B9123D|nr:transketolase C-terminal domain-containing protein [Faecalispora jeddahensis]
MNQPLKVKLEEHWLRDTYVDLLLEYAQKDDRIVALDADLMAASSVKRFSQQMPGRAIDVGVAEANMIGVAAGLAAMGKIPFTHSFTAFASRRVCDQVTLSVAYAGLNVKMVGSDPGITAELNGGTHMSMEDVSIMRNIPGMTVYEPVDSVQLRAAFPQILAHDGPVYIRLLRRPAVRIDSENDEFTLGKASLLREGGDVTILATGIMVAEALLAAEELAGQGISAEVLNVHTIKPFDEEAVLRSAMKTGAVVTAENASVIGGLGSATAECLGENCPVPLRRVGVRDCFGEVGLTDYLKEKFGLTAKEIVRAAHEVTERKNLR